MKAIFERAFGAYLSYFHGEGAEHQECFYRCRRCLRIVTWNIIKKGGCSCSGSAPMFPSNPT